MNRTPRNLMLQPNMKTCTLCWFAAALLAALATPSLPAATAADFGYGTMKENNLPARGTFPLLVITYELTTAGSNRQPLIPNANAVFENMVFNTTTFPNIVHYFSQNSLGQFAWSRAGVLGPVRLTDQETATLVAQQSEDGDGVVRYGLDCGAGIAYLLAQIAAKLPYDFGQWDANGDGSVSHGELDIVLVGNAGERSAANRPIGARGVGQVVSDGSHRTVTLRGRVASLDHRASFTSVAHELSHNLGTKDLYGSGCLSSGLTLMSCTIFAANDDFRTFHLDPWHKMQLGWVEPRVATLASGGTATMAATSVNSPNTPILFYDPARGVDEFFIVEFRNNQVPIGSYDRNLTSSTDPVPFSGVTNGLAIWHYLKDRNPPLQHLGEPNLTPGGRGLWTAMTPVLRWADGLSTRTRLKPLHISADGRELTFEWGMPAEIWVDFAYTGFEDGSFASPFNTLMEGVNGAFSGSTLRLKRGVSGERLTITKILDLEAYNGPVAIGR